MGASMGVLRAFRWFYEIMRVSGGSTCLIAKYSKLPTCQPKVQICYPKFKFVIAKYF